MDCTYYSAVHVNEKFRSVECFTMPHLATVAVSIFASVRGPARHGDLA